MFLNISVSYEKTELQNTIEKAIVGGNVTVFNGDPKELIIHISQLVYIISLKLLNQRI